MKKVFRIPQNSKFYEKRDDELEIRRAVSSIEIKSVSETGEIEGYGSVFGNEDSYGDTVVKGAFEETLIFHKSEKTMPAMLYQHDASEPVGVWTEMFEDDEGLVCKGQLLLETQRGKEVHAMLTAGAIRGLSIGFVAKEWLRTDDEDDYWKRTVTKIDLWEVSVVTFPANRSAIITDVKDGGNRRAIKTTRDLERALRDAGYSRQEATAAIAVVKRSMTDERDARAANDQLLTAINSAATKIQGN